MVSCDLMVLAHCDLTNSPHSERLSKVTVSMLAHTFTGLSVTWCHPILPWHLEFLISAATTSAFRTISDYSFALYQVIYQLSPISRYPRADWWPSSSTRSDTDMTEDGLIRDMMRRNKPGSTVIAHCQLYCKLPTDYRWFTPWFMTWYGAKE